MINELDNDADAQRAEIAAAFGQDLDPLAEYKTAFERMDADPFDLFLADVMSTKDRSERTLDGYVRTFRQWRAFMAERDRHPACPSEGHVKAFIRRELEERDNRPATIKNKLHRLNRVYRYWQDDPAFPHPQDYNPIKLAKSKMDFSEKAKKEPPRIPIEDLRNILAEVTHIRDRAIIVTQLKLGLRATEVCNLKLSEVCIENVEARRHYPEMCTYPALEDHQNAVYIPHHREGNKSKRPRMLPLDDEMRRVLLRYLLIRPATDAPWVFLSKNTYGQLHRESVSDVWADAFHPEYEETERHAAVSSHFGRHRFTTYWQVEKEASRELVKYMRGDTAGSADFRERGAIDEYIHTYYEDIETLYRENIYKLGV
ncbi:MAG: tyrosine-type recombinase/integrase [Salinirussus sp.]